MSYAAKVIAHSIQPDGIDLCTIEMTYPVKVHNEVLTHRAIGKSDEMKYEQWLEFSRNAASDRALTSEQLIALVREHPFIPQFRHATKGMIAGAVFTLDEQAEAEHVWVGARDSAIIAVQALQAQGVHKSERNRLLIPWRYITTVLTANGEMWEHFFQLRDHAAAESSLATTAAIAHEAYRASLPTALGYGEWHLPYIVWEDYAIGNLAHGDAPKVSVARCARTSFLRQGQMVALRDDLTLYNDLVVREAGNTDPPHASPAEHQARATQGDVRSGNFIGFEQYRKVLRL